MCSLLSDIGKQLESFYDATCKTLYDGHAASVYKYGAQFTNQTLNQEKGIKSVY